MLVLIVQGWNTLSLGSESIPALPVVTLMLVVYYASYCLSFWDARVAVSRVLFAFGALWLGFVLLSHGDQPRTMLAEGLVVPGPFLLGAFLCRSWPRTVGVALLALSVGSVWFFHLLPFGETDSQQVYLKMDLALLIPLPLAIGGLALIASAGKDRPPTASLQSDGGKANPLPPQ